MHPSVLPRTLGRNASIDPLVEGTELGRKGREFLLVFLVQLNVVGGKTFNLVNVFHLNKYSKRHKMGVKWRQCHPTNTLTDSKGPLLAIFPAAVGYIPGSCM